MIALIYPNTGVNRPYRYDANSMAVHLKRSPTCGMPHGARVATKHAVVVLYTGDFARFMRRERSEGKWLKRDRSLVDISIERVRRAV